MEEFADEWLTLLNQAKRFMIAYTGAKLDWSIVMWRDAHVFEGMKVWSIQITEKRTSPQTHRAIRGHLQTWTKYFDAKTIITLPIHSQGLAASLRKVGFGVEFVILRGAVSKGLKAVTGAKTLPPRFKIEAMTSTRYLPDIRRIKWQEFRRNPQFGWMCSRRAYLDLDIGRIGKDIRAGLPYHFVFKADDDVVGYFGVFAGNPTKPRQSAGVEIDLAQTAQGHGLARFAYRQMFQTLKKLKVKHFHGGTSHPKVMHLARKMGRSPIAIMLRWQAFENHRQIVAFLRNQ